MQTTERYPERDQNKHNNKKKKQGLSRTAIILIVYLVIMLVILLIPKFQELKQRGDLVACETAMDTARRQLLSDYLLDGLEEIENEKATGIDIHVIPGYDDTCPAGGTVYVIDSKASATGYDLVCGLHGSDTKQCTRLNAEYVYNQVRLALDMARATDSPTPETITVKLHHKNFVCVLTDHDLKIGRGTKTIGEYDGTVVYYGVAGSGEFTGAKDGELVYFTYADSEHCANWSTEKGWTGDSYRFT